MTMQTKQRVADEIVRILRALASAEGERRTMLYRDLAEQTFALREHYLTPAGEPDWSGRSGLYRVQMRELYSAAGYNADDARAVQTATRYHIGNLARQRVSAADLEALGMDTESPAERARRLRREEREIVAKAKEIVAREEARKKKRAQ